MAFKMFVASEKSAKGELKSGGRSSWVKFIPNGKTSVLLIFGTVACDKFGLKEQDPVSIFFDPTTGRVGVRKEKEGSLTLLKHGGNDRVLKVSVTPFVKTHLPKLALPFKTNASVSPRTGMVVFGTTDAKRKPGRPAKTESASAKTPAKTESASAKVSGSRVVEKSAAPTKGVPATT